MALVIRMMGDALEENGLSLSAGLFSGWSRWSLHLSSSRSFSFSFSLSVSLLVLLTFAPKLFLSPSVGRKSSERQTGAGGDRDPQKVRRSPEAWIILDAVFVRWACGVSGFDRDVLWKSWSHLFLAIRHSFFWILSSRFTRGLTLNIFLTKTFRLLRNWSHIMFWSFSLTSLQVFAFVLCSMLL